MLAKKTVGRNAAAFGYPVEHGETVILEAFRQRFRPEATGPIGPADRALMAGLARHYPADVTARIARRRQSDRRQVRYLAITCTKMLGISLMA